jgi:hypothetical protein
MMPDRFSEVMEGLYRGGKPSPKELGMLQDLWGIKKVVSLDEESGKAIQPVCSDLGLKQIIWGLGDGHDPKVAALKKRIVPSLLHEGPTYVHCFHGKDRTGMTVAMFRIYSGWPVNRALAEAFRFGMGKGLPRDVRHSYYDAVKEFARELEEDKNDTLDVVTLTRQTNPFGPGNPGIDDMTRPRGDRSVNIPQTWQGEYAPLSRIAQARLFCKCHSSKLLKPKMFWWGSPAAAINNPADEDGQLFSAALASDTKVERFDKALTKNLMHQVLTREIDVAALRNGQYLVLYPGSLVDIHEETDVNDFFLPEVGGRDSSTDYTFVYPGSGSGLGGMPPSAIGPSTLPYSGPGRV